jgi:hypothetical protein
MTTFDELNKCYETNLRNLRKLEKKTLNNILEMEEKYYL